MTSKTLDWLNSNRFRAYPFVNDLGIVQEGVRIPDCVLLDCQIMDTRHDIGVPELKFTKIVVSEDRTTVHFTYSGISTSCEITSSDSSSDSSYDKNDYLSGEQSFTKLSGIIPTGFPSQFVHVSLTFSSHEYIRENAGIGTWEFNGTILPSKVLTVTASGVSGIKTNGSAYVASAGTAVGNVHLVDGYRTQPIVHNGKVIVRVGTHYGYDPCHYKEVVDDSSSSSEERSVCEDLMFFFCGQNAINSGNVAFTGGPGISIYPGQDYTIKSDIVDSYGKVGAKAGEKIPCIEVVATNELLAIYRPTEIGSSSSGDTSGSSD